MIAYKIRNNLYLNITNRCTNKCDFCIRNENDGVGGYNLWLEKEPTAKEAIKEIGDPSSYDEVVFCGYGEPLIRLDVVKEVCKYVKKYGKPIRINTNGHGNLIHGRNIAPELEGLVDEISISLNAEDSSKYNSLCNPSYGEKTYEAILEFAKECKSYIPKVILSIVDEGSIDIDKCKKTSDKIGVELKVRPLVG